MTRKLTSAEKAAAWDLAAGVLAEHPWVRSLHSGALPAHIREVIVPSLRQRARIIERNARTRK